MSKIKVSFCPSPSVYMALLKDQMPLKLKGRFECIDDFEKSDVIVVWDEIPHHHMNKVFDKKLIYIRAEPPNIKNPNKIEESNFMATFNYPAYELEHLPAIWWINKSYEYLSNLRYEDTHKSRKISCVVSDKWAKRTKFVKMMAFEIDSLDVWGRWIYSNEDEFMSSSQYKGPINGISGANCKSEGLLEYEYSLCIENTSIKNYWTEKIIDSLLLWTMPIYYGATNIDEYFPRDSVRSIDMKRSSVGEVKKIIESSPTSKQIEAMSEARNRILNEYNIWSIIDKLTNGL